MSASINTILNIAKQACHSIWIKRDVYKFKMFCSSHVDITGFVESDNITDGHFGGVNMFPFLNNTSLSFKIEHEDYKISCNTDSFAIVLCQLLICEVKNETAYKHDIFTTFIFDKEESNYPIINAHFSSSDGFGNDNISLSDAPPVVYQPANTDSMTSYYRELITSTCDLFMECDIKEYVYRYDRERYAALFEDDSYHTNPDKWFWNMCDNFVHPDDYERIDIFRKIDIEKRIKNKVKKVETTFRIRNRKNGYIWLSLQLISKLDDNNNLEKLALIFNKLDNSEFNELELIERSRRDDLTNLYNKTYSEYLVNSYLQSYTGANLTAFVLVDIDNFRLVNDTFGHLTGDAILCQFARSMNSFFGNGDLVGRLQGDKFFVLIKTMPSEFEITKSIDNFLKSMHHAHYELGTSLDIHCSAGIIFLNNTHASFNNLYEASKHALKCAKDKGKNCYVIG